MALKKICYRLENRNIACEFGVFGKDCRQVAEKAQRRHRHRYGPSPIMDGNRERAPGDLAEKDIVRERLIRLFVRRLEVR
ncbi:hypothetical protein OA90_21795 [Labrenzia sp. OB1]|nr:hypothetical protein OA90_21795 [Labrenzia sp. OB1]